MPITIGDFFKETLEALKGMNPQTNPREILKRVHTNFEKVPEASIMDAGQNKAMCYLAVKNFLNYDERALSESAGYNVKGMMDSLFDFKEKYNIRGRRIPLESNK